VGIDVPVYVPYYYDTYIKNHSTSMASPCSDEIVPLSIQQESSSEESSSSDESVVVHKRIVQPRRRAENTQSSENNTQLLSD
jgi:hypothetical protein